MNCGFDTSIFRETGFSIIEQSRDSIKVVKDHCEIHIQQDSKAAILELPVIKLWGKREKSQSLMGYLLERNGYMNGPGFFAIKDDCVYYRSIVYCPENIGKVALEMQKTLEQLGPKIINVAKQ